MKSIFLGGLCTLGLAQEAVSTTNDAKTQLFEIGALAAYLRHDDKIFNMSPKQLKVMDNLSETSNKLGLAGYYLSNQFDRFSESDNFRIQKSLNLISTKVLDMQEKDDSFFERLMMNQP
jgi:hypothetical protein